MGVDVLLRTRKDVPETGRGYMLWQRCIECKTDEEKNESRKKAAPAEYLVRAEQLKQWSKEEGEWGL